jgi:hypothetical protein
MDLEVELCIIEKAEFDCLFFCFCYFYDLTYSSTQSILEVRMYICCLISCVIPYN